MAQTFFVSHIAFSLLPVSLLPVSAADCGSQFLAIDFPGLRRVLGCSVVVGRPLQHHNNSPSPKQQQQQPLVTARKYRYPNITKYKHEYSTLSSYSQKTVSSKSSLKPHMHTHKTKYSQILPNHCSCNHSIRGIMKSACQYVLSQTHENEIFYQEFNTHS